MLTNQSWLNKLIWLVDRSVSVKYSVPIWLPLNYTYRSSVVPNNKLFRSLMCIYFAFTLTFQRLITLFKHILKRIHFDNSSTVGIPLFRVTDINISKWIFNGCEIIK